jgi:hypothetical protein
MDPYDRGSEFPNENPRDRQWEQQRRDMGYTLTYANRIPLATMTPQGALASSGYCLAHTGPRDPAYLVYVPEGGSVTVDLATTPGRLAVEWFSPRYDRVLDQDSVSGGARRTLTSPFRGDVVLYLR